MVVSLFVAAGALNLSNEIELMLEIMLKYILLFLLYSVGYVEVVKLLVSRSADKSCKDKQGYTPLHAAAASGHIEIVKYLLRMGAEVSAKLVCSIVCFY